MLDKIIRFILGIIVWIPAILIIMMIFSFSSQTGDESLGLSSYVSELLLKIVDALHLVNLKWNSHEHILEMMQTPIRKIAHILEYGLLTLTVYGAFAYDKLSYRLTKYFTFVMVFLVAVGDEYHQLAVAGRHGNSIDVAIDMLGCIIMIFICMLLDKRKYILI